MSALRKVAIAVGVGALAGSSAADVISPDQAREMVDRGEILSLQEIMRLNEVALEGRIVEIELEREEGRIVYEFKILPGKGRYRKIEIDAASGEVVRRK